ncbi:aryl-alcohol dehydrogenase [Dyadobacter frigoris]|uniref:NAD(P)-dependent alcohol dehydrogenase n=1 Tax=Dyadobacter frigoris TaxID=2576211 RepID=UPI0024A1283C|nr:NAD(P)-dependent alcohol dehydrogenase [Dyadobacter frigoris]GLU57123.1 aryl-alcohol dehydrogenase [Dyadobacter frigoris]
MKIKAAVLEEAHVPFIIKDLELDTELRSTEVLVKVVATGLCHTDLAVRDQHLPVPLPAVLGHEGAGIVEKIGSSVTKVKPGDHVVLAPSSCGKCDYCLSGHPAYCKELFRLNIVGPRTDGSCTYHDHEGRQLGGFFFGQSSFATYSLTSESNVVKVPQDVPLEILGPLGCGIQTGAGTVLNVLNPRARESLVVFGVGPVGLAGLMAAKAAGCTTIIAVDIHDNRLEFARSVGATHTINNRSQEASVFIKENILPEGVHYALDTTGRNEVINQAVTSLKVRGKCALVAVSASSKLEVDNAAIFVGKSIEYVLEGDGVPDIFIPRLIELYKKGLFPFDKLIRFYELEDINQAVEDSESGITLKAVIRMPG